MHRPLVLALILALAAAVAALWFFSRGDVPPPAGTNTTTQAEQQGAAVTENVALPQGGPVAATQRTAVTTKATEDLLDDPDIRAGLTGFRGRVVTHLQQPVADCGVRIYRGAMDTILPAGVDLFAEEATLIPQYVAGETRTAADGTFEIGGVWPRAFYLMFAGIDTDAPMHQILTRTPSPGEVVDLGDIVLPDAGVITGTVLDDNGDPLPGALVRAADLPGSLAAFFPVERFDPDGAILIREPQSPIRVLEMPVWVKGAFENLPIPSTHTGADGQFRLVGVVPGSNLVATTNAGFLSDMKPSIQVRAGQVKDIGRIKLKRGEELTGQVLDAAGKPVADAEVLAGSTLSVAPFDLAQKLGKSDAEGRFRGEGFAPGKVTVAARRGKGHAWILAEPQAILGNVVVTLPTTFGADVVVTLADGKPAKEPRFRLLRGRAGNGAAEMAVFGFVPPVDLRDRQKEVAEGRWRIDNLNPGQYTLVVDAPGHATAFAAFEVAAGDASVQLQLPLKMEFVVRVLDVAEKPIRNVAIFAESRGKGVFDMPLNCGRTNVEGRLVIDKLQGESLRVSADHPRWGVVHGEVKSGQELVLHMQQPGALHGVVNENGKPAELGKFTVVVESRRGDGPRGPLEQTPTLLTPGPDGSFAARALQPGSYRVSVIKAIDALHSPGGVFAIAQEMFMARDLPRETVEVQSGQTAEVQLEAGEKPIDGPTAHLFGTLTVDGKLTPGYFVTAHHEQRRFNTKVDQAGRFDFGTVPVGDLWVTVMGGGEDNFFGGSRSNLWSGSVKVSQAEERELTIVVATSSLGGTCYLPDGSPAAGVFVQARGKLKGVEAGRGEVWLGSPTDAQGRFQFTKVAEGTWTLEVSGNGEKAGRGKLEGVVVNGGIPNDTLRLEMEKTLIVKGRIDLAIFGGKKPRWCYVGFYRIPENGVGEGDYVDGAGIDQESGIYTTQDLAAGRYRVKVFANFDEEKQQRYSCGDIDVPPQGLENLVLLPILDK
jgi:hypothetical protein